MQNLEGIKEIYVGSPEPERDKYKYNEDDDEESQYRDFLKEENRKFYIRLERFRMKQAATRKRFIQLMYKDLLRISEY